MTKVDKALQEFAGAVGDLGYTLEEIRFAEFPARMKKGGGVNAYDTDYGIVLLTARELVSDKDLPLNLFATPKRPVCDDCGRGPVCPGCGRVDC